MHAQNSGQGLGFKLGHTVIDRKTLTSAAAKMVTGFTTIYATLLALSEKPGGSAGAGAAAVDAVRVQEDVPLEVAAESTDARGTATRGRPAR